MEEKKLAVILAGGLSRRMGQNKNFLMLGGRLLIDHVIANIKPQVDDLAINANQEIEKFTQRDYSILPDCAIHHHRGGEFLGPLAGILTAMLWAKKMGGEKVLTISCDCPNLPPDLYQKLNAHISSHDIAIATSLDRTHPTIALWRCGLAEPLRQTLKKNILKIDSFTQNHKTILVDFTPKDKNNPDPFFNLNSPTDVTDWIKMKKL